MNNNSQRCRENGDRRQCSPYNNSQQRIVQRQAQLQHRYRQRDVNGNPPQVNPSILTPEVPDFKSSQVHVPQLTKESPNLNPSDVDPIIPMQEVSEEDVIVNAIWYIPHHGYLPPPPNGPFLMHSLLRYLNFPYKEPNQLIPSPMPPLPRPDTLHSRYTMTFLDLPREARRRGYECCFNFPSLTIPYAVTSEVGRTESITFSRAIRHTTKAAPCCIVFILSIYPIPDSPSGS